MTRKTEEKRLDRSPLHLVHRASQSGDDLLQAQRDSIDLTPRQFAVLEALSRNDGASQRILVDETGIDRSTMADIIQRMLKKSFVKRRRSTDDARAYAVKLTDAGAQALKAARPVMRRIDERLLSPLPARRQEEFLDSLELIITALSEREVETAPVLAKPKRRASRS